MKNQSINRRNFVKKASLLTSSITALGFFSENAFANSVLAEDGIHLIGPKNGYSPQIGTLVSMMTWMRMAMLRSVEGMSVEQLDYIYDPKSNSIGSMLMHLAATDTYYRLHTIENKKWGEWDEQTKSKWDVAMHLGDEARKSIKGNNLDFYLNVLSETREKTFAEFRKKDDQWLMQIDEHFFANQPTNNYCKWFHVCEHESNHNGQIKWIKGRLPGAKDSKE